MGAIDKKKRKVETLRFPLHLSKNLYLPCLAAR